MVTVLNVWIVLNLSFYGLCVWFMRDEDFPDSFTNRSTFRKLRWWFVAIFIGGLISIPVFIFFSIKHVLKRS
jgi:hypothetical protein